VELELVLPDRTVPVLGEISIGRAPGNTLRLPDPTVSRRHALISLRNGTPMLEDAGSSSGTWLDGRRVFDPQQLHDGARIRLGDQEFLVARRRGESEAGPTIYVPADDPAASAAFAGRPRVRRGYALKRLETGEGRLRWMLKDFRSGRFLRLSDADAELFRLIDGTRSFAELVEEAERLYGETGAPRLARLLGDLAERGFLTGVDRAAPDEVPPGRLQRLFTPREKVWTGAGDLFDWLYRRGGFLLFTRPALAAYAVLSVVGVVVFAYLVAGRYGTPFVVARKIGLGGLVFLLGRFALVAAHETAHGLTMSLFGRRVPRAGLKLVLIFPYAFVDTSDAWFEPRRRRIAVSAAGPVSDIVLGAVFSLCCLGLAAGTARDIFFQLGFGAYLGAFYNLNPGIERDGYQILVDVLREPGLRRRAREQLQRRLGGGGRADDSPVLARYGGFVVGWAALAGVIAVAMSLRYESTLAAYLPVPVTWLVLMALWVGGFTPLVAIVGRPLLERIRTERGPP
jgi:FHA domain